MQGAARKTGRVKAARANAGMKIGTEGVRLPDRLPDKAGCERRYVGGAEAEESARRIFC